VTVGHLARSIEAVGIPTVSVYVEAFLPTAQLLKPPRVLLTPHIMGRPLGLPYDRETQRATILAALRMLETAANAPTLEVIRD
jgi:hypothetical protein